jgi:hypothetical protein
MGADIGVKPDERLVDMGSQGGTDAVKQRVTGCQNHHLVAGHPVFDLVHDWNDVPVKNNGFSGMAGKQIQEPPSSHQDIRPLDDLQVLWGQVLFSLANAYDM